MRLTTLSRSIAGKLAVVTGAASGMGRATAQVFADERARVVVADLACDRVEAVVDSIRAEHGAESALGVTCDVTNHTELKRLVESAVGWAGGIDILVNNAGVSLETSTLQPEREFEARWSATLAVNLTAQARLVRLSYPWLAQSGAGRVVNVASTEALVASPHLAAYAASKAGVIGLTQALAVELGQHGVTVNCICPGPIRTAMTAEIPEEDKAVYARRRVPLRRYGEPEEVAHMTLNLCLPSSSFVNGTVVTVDGGMTVRHV